MQVVILCGGLGTRLREETEFRPKPMVNIGPRPVLWHIMKRYAHFDHTEFILCLGYKGESIKEYFYHYEIMNNDFSLELGNAGKFILHNGHTEKGWNITLADTGEKALKGARIKRIQKYIHGDEFMLTYGDGVCDVDLEALLTFHRDHGKMITITGVNSASQFGEMRVQGNQVLTFREKPQTGDSFINGGYMVLKKEIFNYLIDDDGCDFEVGPLEQLARGGQLMVYKHPGSWACMDTLRDTERLNKMWEQGKAFWKIW
ncbi:MAG: glucose-1-phosphate cytidylyltransferase [Chitinivibrionales bacterium]|nr:glucose-1-phosphate cytidylyltransferase [Chitinivibrionales bacterium]